MDFSKEHFVNEKAFEDFEHGINVFWGELIRLNSTVFILEKIMEFPFELFSETNKLSFFSTVITNFLDAAILIISRLTDDSSRQAEHHHTLNRFRTRLTLELIKPEYHRELNQRLKAVGENNEAMRAMLNKVKAIRDDYIAHLNRNLIYGVSQLPPLYLSDLQCLCNRLNEVFEILDLTPGLRMMTYLQYSDLVQWPKGMDGRPDIVIILDETARRSPLLNMPEEQPNYWEFHRQRLTEQEIEQLNCYRQKFGLSKI